MSRKPKARPRKPTPKEQGLHAVSLILSEELYEGMRLHCFRNRIRYQDLLRRLLGEHLASKGILRPVEVTSTNLKYELVEKTGSPGR